MKDKRTELLLKSRLQDLVVRSYGIYVLVKNPYPEEERWRNAVGRLQVANLKKAQKDEFIRDHAVRIGSLYVPIKELRGFRQITNLYFGLSLKDLNEWTKEKGWTFKLWHGAKSLIRFLRRETSILRRREGEQK